MAAFLEGTLDRRELAEVTGHLRECEDCRTVTGEAARFEQEEGETKRSSARFRWWIAPAAAAAAAIAFIALRPTPIERLIDASPREYRRVQGRLSGFPWARLQGAARGATPSPAELELNSAAYAVLDRTAGDDAVDARHAAGVAHLLIDQTAAGLDKLAGAAGDSRDAHVWNDLAAARFTVAAREGLADPLALAAVKRAIELDPTLAEAHFNHALILEHLNLRDQAREAWKRYLAIDPASDWSTEARHHLDALGEPQADVDIGKELARAARNREAIGSREAITALVRRFPQDSRTTGEGPLLGEWAGAYLANGAARAEEKLSLIRTVAEELAAAKGERMLLDTLDGMRDRTAFAKAFRAYVEGRIAYGDRDLAAAEERLRSAAAQLRAIRSPFAGVAEYYAAQCAFDDNRPVESNEALLALRARLDPAHRALSAEIDAALARNANASADWAAAARFAARASATATDLGESELAATAMAWEAIALAGLGAVDDAWRQSVLAIGMLRDRHRIATILHSAGVALAAADDTDTARAVMDVAAEYQSLPETRVAILIDRARLAERAGDLADAHRSLGEARAVLAELDPAIREAREAQIHLADAVVRRASDPRGAIAALDDSIAFYERLNHGIRLPDAYLQRARAYRAIGRTDAALADATSALRKIREQQAQSIEFLDVAAQTIDEMIDLHLERGEVAEAFAVTDRAHAMARGAYARAAIPEGTAVIEYAVLPRSVVIFAVTREGIAAARKAIDRNALAARVRSFARKLQTREDVSADAASLHTLLIAPVAQQLAGARELVIVPDRDLNMLPFAALNDGTRYLIETQALRIAPSAAALPPTANRQPPTTATIIGDPATTRAPFLPWSRDEATRIAAIHETTAILGESATRARVAEAIASSAVVHYAGHANSDLASYGALLLAPDTAGADLLTSSDIARLDLRNHPLIVLSACGTLRGETTHIAGMPSLARAFLGAGARAVVGTLWEIDDDVASPLFIEFHERLRAGEVPAGALRAAQLAMLQSSEPRLRHPSSWSAVEVLSNL